MINLASADEAALRTVCAQRWQEGQALDFKRDPPGRDDKAKREFLKDVCAFANVTGGWLVFGIEDEDGAAKEIVPITSEGRDDVILRLGQIIDSGIEPRLRGWQMRPVDVAGGYALVLKVPASFDGPHRFLVNDASRFVLRSGRHIVDMAYQQLRAAFGNTATLSERARSFRAQRIAAIPVSASPNLLRPGPIVAIHVIPLQAMSGRDGIDVTPFYFDYTDLTFADWGGGSRLLNLDGVVAHVTMEGSTFAATRLFRSGALEFLRFGGLTIKDDKTVPSLTIAKFMREALPKSARILERAEVRGPALVSIAMLRMSGYGLALNRMDHARPPDRSDLLFPEQFVEDVGELQEADRHVKPTLDLLWQSYGQPACGYYVDGKWAPRE